MTLVTNFRGCTVRDRMAYNRYQRPYVGGGENKMCSTFDQWFFKPTVTIVQLADFKRFRGKEFTFFDNLGRFLLILNKNRK